MLLIFEVAHRLQRENVADFPHTGVRLVIMLVRPMGRAAFRILSFVNALMPFGGAWPFVQVVVSWSTFLTPASPPVKRGYVYAKI